MISKSITSEYFRWSNSTGNQKKEPYAISDDKALLEFFEHSKYNHLIELLRRVHTYSAISVATIAYFLDCDFQKANEILNAFNSDLGDFSEFI